MPNAPAGAPPEPRRLPAIDERLVMPETRYEILDGRVVYVSPADPPHASRHSKLSALLEAFKAEGYDAASDMLTRTSRTNDIAPDGSVYPLGPDPVTGGRRLEDLAFEIVSTQTMSYAGKKAARLMGRGVRRVFGVDVERNRVLEWSRSESKWKRMQDDAEIADPAFALPLPVRALVDAARADDAVARALLAKHNPVIREAIERSGSERHAQGRREGRLEGLAAALITMLRTRGLAIESDQEARILTANDEALLEAWLERAASCASVADLLDPTEETPRRSPRRP